MSTILLTGFEAFDHTPVNPAELVAKELDGAEIGGAKVVARIVPNTFFTCIDVVRAAIAELQPEAVVMMGERPRDDHGREDRAEPQRFSALSASRQRRAQHAGRAHGAGRAGRLLRQLAVARDGAGDA